MKAGLDKLKRGMDEALADTGTSKTWEMDPKTLHRTMLSLDEDHKLEDFLDALPALFRNVTSNSYNDLRTALEPHIMRVTRRLLGTCSTGQLHNSARRQRLTACLDAIWCFRKTMERYFSVVRDHWMHGGDGKHDHWALLSTEVWAMATKMTADSDPITALHAHCVQALIAVMRQHKRWDCSKAEWSAHLHRQLGTPVDVIERHLDSKADHLQLAVAANLLTHALPLLRDIEAKDGHATSLKLKAEVKAIMDSICNGMDASDVPEDLQIRFVDVKEVKEVFHVRQPGLRAYRHRIDMTGSWTNVFVPGSTSDTGEDSTGSKSARPPNLTARLGHFIRRENMA
ncbi:hypothetical protein EI94DRAFT_1261580 [Lactarius quietus]|nr:hypothetical protein EI94DRAFT_1261580 [Lactarius quietus]